MKKRLSLDQLNIKSFKTTYQAVAKGGNNMSYLLNTECNQCPDYTYNRWCHTDSDSIGAFCTAPV
ncbi:MAG: hypothetical protein WBB45_20265 [Cyclobacteriaceae bacterium]